MTDKSKIISQCLALISATYAAKFPTNEYTAGVWIVLLDDIPPDELQAAVIDWCRTMDWPPTPAELRKRCPSQCKCGQCISCKRKIAQQIIQRGAAKRLNGSGSYGIEPSDWALFRDSRNRLGPAQDDGE